ncbi:MAG: hypothetical protein DCF16_09745 [Alphaproteobacteria bacterium]|nr:MAG: hypothetical protein DCF16_09745 [Alphaproteobacteria bacterium]
MGAQGAFVGFVALWALICVAIVWRQLKSGEIRVFGESLVVRRVERPILFWLSVSGALGCLLIGTSIIAKLAFDF